MDIVSFFSGIQPEWAVFWLSMIPLTEMQVSIPVGIAVYNLAWWKVFIIATVGNIIPGIFIVYLLPYLHDWIVKQKILGDLATRYLVMAEKKFSGDFAKYGAWGLIAFIGLPFPLTGIYTASAAAFVFNIPFKKAMPVLAIAIVLAATVLTLITLFADGALKWLL